MGYAFTHAIELPAGDGVQLIRAALLRQGWLRSEFYVDTSKGRRVVRVWNWRVHPLPEACERIGS